ncbi:MAG: hypothetical protein ABIJ86_04110 [Spirochaetota bacterium]
MGKNLYQKTIKAGEKTTTDRIMSAAIVAGQSFGQVIIRKEIHGYGIPTVCALTERQKALEFAGGAVNYAGGKIC